MKIAKKIRIIIAYDLLGYLVEGKKHSLILREVICLLQDLLEQYQGHSKVEFLVSPVGCESARRVGGESLESVQESLKILESLGVVFPPELISDASDIFEGVMDNIFIKRELAFAQVQEVSAILTNKKAYRQVAEDLDYLNLKFFKIARREREEKVLEKALQIYPETKKVETVDSTTFEQGSPDLLVHQQPNRNKKLFADDNRLLFRLQWLQVWFQCQVLLLRMLNSPLLTQFVGPTTDLEKREGYGPNLLARQNRLPKIFHMTPKGNGWMNNQTRDSDVLGIRQSIVNPIERVNTSGEEFVIHEGHSKLQNGDFRVEKVSGIFRSNITDKLNPIVNLSAYNNIFDSNAKTNHNYFPLQFQTEKKQYVEASLLSNLFIASLPQQSLPSQFFDFENVRGFDPSSVIFDSNEKISSAIPLTVDAVFISDDSTVAGAEQASDQQMISLNSALENPETAKSVSDDSDSDQFGTVKLLDGQISVVLTQETDGRFEIKEVNETQNNPEVIAVANPRDPRIIWSSLDYVVFQLTSTHKESNGLIYKGRVWENCAIEKGSMGQASHSISLFEKAHIAAPGQVQYNFILEDRSNLELTVPHQIEKHYNSAAGSFIEQAGSSLKSFIYSILGGWKDSTNRGLSEQESSAGVCQFDIPAGARKHNDFLLGSKPDSLELPKGDGGCGIDLSSDSKRKSDDSLK